MKQTELQTIVQRSTTKKDGVYSYNGIKYRVIDEYPKFIAQHNKIYEYSHGFLVEIGNYDYDSKTKLLLIGK